MSFDPEYGAIMTIGGKYYSRYHPNRDVKTFQDGAEHGELLVKKCEACGVRIHPSRLSCPKCLSTNLNWIKTNKKGSVYSYSVIHHPYIPELKEKVPYNLVLVMLDEGVLFYSILLHCDEKNLKIGMRVQAIFDKDNLFGVTLPKFQPTASKEEGLLRSQ
ncbi:MAG: OB-fold domain-containing protein [Nitrososphaerota archaeon]|nr:OB-fold domain-containing protein [Nitrososphaerota archaeon]